MDQPIRIRGHPHRRNTNKTNSRKRIPSNRQNKKIHIQRTIQQKNTKL